MKGATPRGRAMPRYSEGSAIVTDSALRTALYTIRSLGRHGVRVTAVERPTAPMQDLGGLSRYVTRRVTVPDNRQDRNAFVDALLQVAEGHDVLMPIGMHSIEPIARRAPEFEGRIKMALPSWEVIERADRTRMLLDVAAQLGVPCPRQYDLCQFANLSALAATVTYPAIVKTGLEAGLPPRDRYQIVHSADDLIRSFRRMEAVTASPIIQELVQGEGLGFEALYDYDGRLVARFCHRRLREYPLSGGPSTFCESCHAPLVEEYARRLLEHLGWVGQAMVEFKVDARSGEPVLMEVNPRPWGSMALPIRAGVDFPWLAYRLARDGALAPQPDYADGIRLRFLVNDVQAAFAAARTAATIQGRVRIFASLLDPTVHEGVLSITDPLPSYAYLVKGLRLLRQRSSEAWA